MVITTSAHVMRQNKSFRKHKWKAEAYGNLKLPYY
uniref:Uncharacterized protein n=1 Tax=Anguilla anguilla TaxID=7936 RepID=A0A0E9V500_ANGAN